MRREEAIEAEKNGALITDGAHVYRIVGHKHYAYHTLVFIIQRQSIGTQFKQIEVDPITVTNMWRVKK
ncbi:hypothetical protein [Limosilactobacillus galli]|uniref:hypothetical protein n=1 Tax=Limosilactobacillus galli TaxID=2991834 RepID=UPI0024B9F3C3|nr:hypothetical protein [Limosilactobacillus galli]